MKGSTFSLSERRPVYDPRLILQYVLMNWVNWAAYKKSVIRGAHYYMHVSVWKNRVSWAFVVYNGSSLIPFWSCWSQRFPGLFLPPSWLRRFFKHDLKIRDSYWHDFLPPTVCFHPLFWLFMLEYPCKKDSVYLFFFYSLKVWVN